MNAPITRRALVGGATAAALALDLVPAPARADHGWKNIDVSHVSLPLKFAMERVNDDKAVTQATYKGRVTLLYFGYTYCPDVCPTTLTNVAHVLHTLGKQADDVRLLFVTVDPNRDTPKLLKQYVAAFAPQIDGLRGTPDALAALAQRYRIAYSVTPGTPGHPYEVTHSSAIYVFDKTGAARLLIPSMDSETPDIDGTAADLRRLIDGEGKPGFISRALSVFQKAI